MQIPNREARKPKKKPIAHYEDLICMIFIGLLLLYPVVIWLSSPCDRASQNITR